mgnify:CR=1 FL=1
MNQKKTVPANGLSIESAIEKLSESSIVALIDICEAFIDGYVHEELGFTFKFSDDDENPEDYTADDAWEILSTGLVYLHPVSINGSWLVLINKDVIQAVAEKEDLDTEKSLDSFLELAEV